jgi:hypothetical protein
VPYGVLIVRASRALRPKRSGDAIRVAMSGGIDDAGRFRNSAKLWFEDCNAFLQAPRA